MKYRTASEKRALRLMCSVVNGDFDPEVAVEVDKDGAYIDPSSIKYRNALMAYRKARRESAEKE